MSANLFILHGPNLNLLGKRETSIYGSDTLDIINARIKDCATELGYTTRIEQRNAEHELLELIHENAGQDFIILNPAAFTHTSVALRDALLGTESKFIEVHLSNPHSREPFRQHSYFSDVAVAVICGCGARGYEFAVHTADDYLRRASAVFPAGAGIQKLKPGCQPSLA